MARKIVKKTSKKKRILFVINPIFLKDRKSPLGYDVLAIGEIKHLRKIEKEHKYGHLIKISSFAGVPILILDTCPTLRYAYEVLKEVRKYEKKVTGKTLQEISGIV